MTAHHGRGWRLAPSLIALEREANRIAPRRSQRSDGSIGDRSHASRASDHNPKWGWVHALDLTHSPATGFDAHGHARAVAARRDARVDYIISNGQIWTPESEWQRYSGSNPHRSHAHFSIHKSAWARNNVAPWLGGTPAPTPSAPAPSKPSMMPTEEEDDVTVLVRNDPKQGGDGAVIAVSGRFFTRVGADDYEFMQFITGGPDAVRQSSPANFNKFLSTHVDAQNVNNAAWYAKAAAGA